MAVVNHVVLVGRLTKDPEFREGEKQMLKFGLAVSRFGKDAGADFVDIVTYGQAAVKLEPLLGKGRLVMVEGRLHQARWETQDGAQRSKVEVVAYNVQVLDRPKGDQEDAAEAHEGRSRAADQSEEGDEWS